MAAPVEQIVEQMQFISNALTTWAQQEGGGASVVQAHSMNHFWEYLQAKERSPLLVVAYEGEDIRGDEATAENVGVVDRHFIVGLRRHRGYPNSPGDKLTLQVGQARPMLQIVGELRDVLRVMEMPYHLCLARPIEYKATRAAETASWMDAYVIEFSILTQLPTLAPGFGDITP